MEEGIAVRDAILLIVDGAVRIVSLIEVLLRWTILNQSGLVASQRQLVDLSVAGIADAEKS